MKNERSLNVYVRAIRFWFFACPFIALIILHYNQKVIWHFYEGFLILVCVVCVLSQFFSGSSRTGIDIEQKALHEEAVENSKRKWGEFRITPLELCLPAMLVVFAIEVAQIFD